mmetsp:Transcript_7562/g.16456  ORF Transcript_7562/g.16456 Transcript_7562/m.16456 type:complete len:91 (-) Transcript_7562:56-328(-)
MTGPGQNEVTAAGAASPHGEARGFGAQVEEEDGSSSCRIADPSDRTWHSLGRRQQLSFLAATMCADANVQGSPHIAQQPSSLDPPQLSQQ